MQDVGVKLRYDVADDVAFDAFVARHAMPAHTGPSVPLPGVSLIFGMLYEEDVRVAVLEPTSGFVVVAQRCVGHGKVYRNLSACVTGHVPANAAELVTAHTGVRVVPYLQIMRFSLPDDVVACIPTIKDDDWTVFAVGDVKVTRRRSSWSCIVRGDCNACRQRLAAYIQQHVGAPEQ
jgi:hypothetical protein